MTAAATGGSPPALSVMVVEDEPLFRDLLVNALLSHMPDATVTGSYPAAETGRPVVCPAHEVGRGSGGSPVTVPASPDAPSPRDEITACRTRSSH